MDNIYVLEYEWTSLRPGDAKFNKHAQGYFHYTEKHDINRY